MKIDKYTYWKLNDIEDYDNFIKQASKEGCKWFAGQALEDTTMRSGVIHLGFPLIMEIDNNEKTVSIASANKEKFAGDFKKHYKPIVPVKDRIVAIPDSADIIALSFKDNDGNTLNFTEEGVRDNLEDILKTIRNRFTSFRVGDKVYIINDKQYYDSYADWFEENNVPVKIAAKYAFDQAFVRDFDSEGYKVLAVGEHKGGDGKLYAIQLFNSSFSPVYLFNEKGLSKIL
jgi:hypothetical protein